MVTLPKNHIFVLWKFWIKSLTTFLIWWPLAQYLTNVVLTNVEVENVQVCYFIWKMIKFSNHIKIFASFHGSIYFITNYNFILYFIYIPLHLHVIKESCYFKIFKCINEKFKLHKLKIMYFVNVTNIIAISPKWISCLDTKINHFVQIGMITILLKCQHIHCNLQFSPWLMPFLAHINSSWPNMFSLITILALLEKRCTKKDLTNIFFLQ